MRQIELQQEREEEERRRQEENVKKYLESRSKEGRGRLDSPRRDISSSLEHPSSGVLDSSAMKRWDSFAQRMQSPRGKPFDSVHP